MSLKEPDRDREKDDSQRESAREKRRRQRAAAKRQKALAASERKRRKESPRKPAVKPADEPKAKPPEAKKPAAKKPAPKKLPPRKPEAAKPKAEKSKAEKPDADKLRRRRRRFGARPRRPGQVAGKTGTASKAPATGSGKSRRPAGEASKVGDGLRKVGGSGVALVVEILKLAREMLVIPLQVWLGIAEVVGGAVLAVWLRVVLPALRLIVRSLGALLRFGERHVTPARALTVVALVAVGALVAAQWRDYSAISVGTDAYAGDVGAVAPPPEVSSAPAHDAHGWVMLILAALAVFALVGALAKRRRLSVWLIPIGVAVLAISIGIDAPKGLDEGQAALAYESANASLLSGFWLQIAAGAVLIACGLMLPRALRPASASARGPAELGPSLIDRLVARARGAIERRRARPKRERRLPRKLRRPTAKGKVQGAGT
jgi:hypothetical protein